MENENKKVVKWLGAFIFAILLIIIYKILDNFAEVNNMYNRFMHVISPFLIGILMAYLLYIPCKKFEKLFDKSKIKFISNGKRHLSIFSVYILFILIIVILIKFAVPVIWENIVDLINNIPVYYNVMLESARNIPEDSILSNLDLYEKVTEFQLPSLINLENIGQYAKSAIGIIGNLFNMIISIAFSVYILIERKSIVKFLDKLTKALLQKNIYETIKKYFAKTNEIFFTFIGSKVLDSIINWIVVTTVLSLLGVRYALLLGIIGGICNLIPYLGSIVSTIMISVITIFTGGITQALTVLAILIAFQQLDSNIIEPKIMRNALKISPILVILSVIVGRAYFGIIGMFLAVPTVTVLKTMLLDYIEFRQKQKIE